MINVLSFDFEYNPDVQSQENLQTLVEIETRVAKFCNRTLVFDVQSFNTWQF